jgi:hypothetical protein
VTNSDATTLIARIKHTWRGGAHVDVWREVLVDLDAGTAGTTIVRLARDLDDPPSIAAFLRAYRALRTPANDPIPQPAQPRCEACGGDGWVVSSPLIAHNPVMCSGSVAAGTCHCHAVEPCRCSAGAHATELRQRITAHNDRLLAGLRPGPGDR